jgi:hypothetical protein
MTNQAATDVRQWLVSARSRGELLTSTAKTPGIDLVMVGVPAGYSSEEVESWLRDLMGMSLETSSTETGERPIPALLHHLLTGLIFSHSELWDRGGAAAPASMAFVRTAKEVAFGWVNGPAPDLWIDDHPARVEWVRIRDQDGREAFALSIDPAHRVRVHFGLGAAPAGASVDAAWVPEVSAAESATPATSASGPVPVAAQGEPSAERSASAISRAVGARASADDVSADAPAVARTDLGPASTAPRPMPAHPPAPPGDGWTVVYEGEGRDTSTPSPPARGRDGKWWSSMVNWVSRGQGKDKDAGDAMSPESASPPLPERIPPSPEPAELTARAAPPVSHTAAHSGMREIQLSPLAPEETRSIPRARPEPAPELQLESARLEPPARRGPAPMGATNPGAASAQAPVAAVPAAPARVAAVPAAAAPAMPAMPAASAAPAVSAPATVAAPVAAPVATPVVTPATLDNDSPFIEPDFGERFATAPGSEPGRVPLRPRWADSMPSRDEPPLWSRPWVWAVLVALLFVVGWMVGGLQNDRGPGEASAMSRALRVVGLGGARFEASVQSHPPDAWIMVDGKDIARRTPADIDLPPGTHQITLSFADLGSASFEVRGVRGEKVSLVAPLWGSLAVYAGDGGIPVAITVDGVMRGLAPVTVDSLSPGTHEVRFSGPGLQPWGQTVQVRVRETAQVVARAVTSPATGVLEIRSLWTDAEGSEELTGATVYVDGEKRGVTPMTLELPRGPHSVRIESRGEQSAVQVIDLPGGNQRFANFELGLGIDRPALAVLGTPIRVPLDQPAVISAALQGMHAGEAREMWLHLRQPDGAWRRYPMVMMKAPGGIVGSTVFPNTLLDAQGRTPFYVSATNQTGDEFYSEIHAAQEAPAGRRP